MKFFKYILFFSIWILAQNIYAQNFIPKFVEPEFSTIIDTSKLHLYESFHDFLPQPSVPFKMIEPQSDNFPKDWDTFKKAFLALKLPEEYLYLYKNLSFMNQYHKEYVINYSNKVRWSPLNPIQSFYNAFSKEAKEIQKYNQLMKTDFIEKSVGEKCPMDVVKIITGTISDSMVYAFFRFCNFSQEQIEKATPYEVCMLVTENWKIFVGCKQEEEDSISLPAQNRH